MEYFIKMPDWILTCPIGSYSKILYCYLANKARLNDRDNVRIAMANLASQTGSSVWTVRRSLAELSDAGLVEIEHQSSNKPPTIYVSFSPAKSDGAKCTSEQSARAKCTSDRAKCTSKECKMHQHDRAKCTNDIHYIKEYKKNIKRTSTRTRACARERKTYDTNLFRNKDSFPEEKEG